MNNMLERIKNDILKMDIKNIGYMEAEKLEKECMRMYDRYNAAFQSQYVNGNCGTPSIFLFLALPEEYSRCLYVDIGSIVKNVSTGEYNVVDGWGMSGYCVFLKCTDPNGKEVHLGAYDYEKSDIPSSVLGIAKAQLRKMCPIMCPNEGSEDEN